MRLIDDKARDELLGKLRAFAKSSHPEWRHYDADQALVDYINDPEIAAAYDAVRKRYV